MKSFFVRLSVLALATTAFTASTVTSKASNSYEIKKATVATAGPAAMCPPDGSQGYCGMR